MIMVQVANDMDMTCGQQQSVLLCVHGSVFTRFSVSFCFLMEPKIVIFSNHSFVILTLGKQCEHMFAFQHLLFIEEITFLLLTGKP
jgi:hypothetical protein